MKDPHADPCKARIFVIRDASSAARWQHLGAIVGLTADETRFLPGDLVTLHKAIRPAWWKQTGLILSTENESLANGTLIPIATVMWNDSTCLSVTKEYETDIELAAPR